MHTFISPSELHLLFDRFNVIIFLIFPPQIAESICDFRQPGGEWLRKLDVTQDGKNLALVHHDEGVAKCGETCATLTLACQLVCGMKK